jgi:hypothetical protein
MVKFEESNVLSITLLYAVIAKSGSDEAISGLNRNYCIS